MLRRTFSTAVAQLVKSLGKSPKSWHKADLCPKQSPPRCDENLPTTAGAVETPPQPFENRGTFHQAVEIR